MIYCPWRRGATAWEWQCGRLWLRYCFLKGGNWTAPSWGFWQRLEVIWINDKQWYGG